MRIFHEKKNCWTETQSLTTFTTLMSTKKLARSWSQMLWCAVLCTNWKLASLTVGHFYDTRIVDLCRHHWIKFNYFFHFSQIHPSPINEMTFHWRWIDSVTHRFRAFPSCVAARCSFRIYWKHKNVVQWDTFQRQLIHWTLVCMYERLHDCCCITTYDVCRTHMRQMHVFILPDCCQNKFKQVHWHWQWAILFSFFLHSYTRNKHCEWAFQKEEIKYTDWHTHAHTHPHNHNHNPYYVAPIPLPDADHQANLQSTYMCIFSNTSLCIKWRRKKHIFSSSAWCEYTVAERKIN